MNSSFAPWVIWFVTGAVLALLELQVPGMILVFFGVGCWLTAGALLIWDLSLVQQLLVFMVGSVATLLLLRRWIIAIFRGSSPDEVTGDWDDFPKGLHVKVTAAITPEMPGRVSYRGTDWPAKSDAPAAVGDTVSLESWADESHMVFEVRRINPNSTGEAK